MANKVKWAVGIVAALVVAGAIANADDKADDKAPSGTPTTSTTTAERAVETSPPPKTCTVPNVVGMVHQTAQDTMQAAGLYFLREEDATGQGRLLILDRNWTTVAQSVAAGQVVDCTTTVTLSAKKIGE
ncbi:hypothetical protein [Actinosynnema sp. NPDC020468]|uniref:PASTA domain-containing protein n=1 Tax=Actinosynnema sp. NPDC020468 TaxID=3154488 RepID=UPI0033EF557B